MITMVCVDTGKTEELTEQEALVAIGGDNLKRAMDKQPPGQQRVTTAFFEMRMQIVHDWRRRKLDDSIDDLISDPIKL